MPGAGDASACGCWSVMLIGLKMCVMVFAVCDC